jgi:two-component system, cell cycle sensor histidine kinase and response regulator CckA
VLRRLMTGEIALRVTLPERAVPVEMDRGQIEQVLLNLTINARDAMPAGGTVTVSTTNVELDEVYALQHAGVPPGRYVRITVGDSGSGMPPEVLERAFEPFFTTKPPGAGTGLGLATVYGIVKQAGGHIGLYSDDGQGTTVRITLPACFDAAETTAPGSPVAAPAGRGETVLVVEDDPAVRALATRLLAEAGYRVIDAQSPEEARQHAAHARMDLLVTDVIMPGMSGSQLAAVLAAQQPSLRVLFMSGYTDDVVMRHGVLERRLAFVDKPFTRASLLRGVRDALDGATGDEAVDA